jgi:hypothetical protein
MALTRRYGPAALIAAAMIALAGQAGAQVRAPVELTGYVKREKGDHHRQR